MTRHSKVYFIVSTEQNAVKIGYAKDVRARWSTLQTGNPHPLQLQAIMRGTKVLEQEMHERFVAYHIRGEWYKYEGDLRRFVDSLPKYEEPYAGLPPGWEWLAEEQTGKSAAAAAA